MKGDMFLLGLFGLAIISCRIDKATTALNRIADSLKGQAVVSLGPLCQEQPQPFHSIPTPLGYELVILSNMVSVVDGTNVVWSEAEGGAK